ncbi:hypothetical protein I302_100110 [Kwoniella bestiolae CBS 10118]|uniref:Methyltransferase type 11 domain-containing protein n=1 Tax=Kwoniella bestiolae CBS 10118 TaxID=1296100 RepID=A0A1B9G480_9TREE|nr:hypothetical protein I302_03484 [Kwoniella bestiolae CBS 10118]OCF25811.1 hypothetical protein I302_03484 [Kwoniella bestiolae CBS 10118]
MSSSRRQIPYAPRSSPSTTPFPYGPRDLEVMDDSPDDIFYSEPRFVTHIDDGAIAALRTYFSEVLPTTKGSRILDMCTSWISHYPPNIEEAVKDGIVEVVGIGMNDSEMKYNPVLKGKYVVKDLNRNPVVSGWPGDEDITGEVLYSTTCTVSIDYLTKPLEVLTSLLERTKKGGSVHLIISNRCFPSKVVARWMGLYEEDRLKMVGDYLAWSGWKHVEILTLKEGGRFIRGDPLWVVRGRKE